MKKNKSSYDGLIRRGLLKKEEHGYGDYTPVLDWIQGLFSTVEFTRLITVTFKKPETVPFKLERPSQSIVNRIRRCFFQGRRNQHKQLTFLFINERFPLRLYVKPDYHLHFLMTEPTNTNRDESLQQGSKTENLELLIRKCVAGSRFSGSDSAIVPS